MDLSYSDTYISSTIVVISGKLISERINWMLQYNVFVEDQVLLQQKEGSNDLVGPKYYVSPVGVPCCHCRMDKSFFKKALRYHTKKKFRTNPQWEILFQKRMIESNQTKQEKICMPRLRTVRVCGVNQPPI